MRDILWQRHGNVFHDTKIVKHEIRVNVRLDFLGHRGSDARLSKYHYLNRHGPIPCPNRPSPASQALDPSRSVSAVLERAGAKALFAADEFFAARISNPHTRRAYARIVRRFLTWCEDEHLELPQVSPGLAGRFIDELPGDSSTKNQALAALRHFFDTLVTRHAAPLNPFQSVRGRMGQ